MHIACGDLFKKDARGSITLLCDCNVTYQSVEEWISKTAITKKILETSCGKILNPVYQNYIPRLSTNYDY